MTDDSIIDELHQQRAEAMERFNFDFDFEGFCRHLKEEERLSGKPLVSPAETPPNLGVQRTRSVRR
jgi:hypothetical protein